MLTTCRGPADNLGTMTTFAISVAGLVLAVASIGWQVYSFALSGSRVTVEVIKTPFAGAKPDDVSTAAVRPSAVGSLKLSYTAIAVIRNRGRLPITIQTCFWYVTQPGSNKRNLNSLDQKLVAIHEENMPAIGRLEANDTLSVRLDPATYAAVSDVVISAGKASRPLSGDADAEHSYALWARVELGNGKRVIGGPLWLKEESST